MFVYSIVFVSSTNFDELNVTKRIKNTDMLCNIVEGASQNPLNCQMLNGEVCVCTPVNFKMRQQIIHQFLLGSVMLRSDEVRETP